MTTLTENVRDIERRIPLPRDDRPPLKVNLFERMQGGNCQLMPLFPYEDADSLVPAGAIFRGRRRHGSLSRSSAARNFALEPGLRTTNVPAAPTFTTS